MTYYSLNYYANKELFGIRGLVSFEFEVSKMKYNWTNDKFSFLPEVRESEFYQTYRKVGSDVIISPLHGQMGYHFAFNSMALYLYAKSYISGFRFDF